MPDRVIDCAPWAGACIAVQDTLLALYEHYYRYRKAGGRASGASAWAVLGYSIPITPITQLLHTPCS
jgi:hypothetical protein